MTWRGEPTPRDVEAAGAAVRAVSDPDTVIEVVAVDDLERLPSGKRWILRREPDQPEVTPAARPPDPQAARSAASTR